MKARYFLKVLGITIFSLFLLNSLGMAQIHYDSSGKVGFGITSPAEKLDVVGAIKLGTTSSRNKGTIRWTGTDFQGYNGSSWLSLTAPGSGGPCLWTDAGSYIHAKNAPNVVVTDSGDVGIGKTNPDSAKLEVVTTSNQVAAIFKMSTPYDEATAGYFQVESEGSPFKRALINLGGDLVNDLSIIFAGNNHNGYQGLKFYVNNNWQPLMAMTIANSGNVGIGTTSPSQKLDVRGNVIANSYYNHSDSQLKKNIASIDNALDKVLALRGVEFEWRIEEYPEKGFAEGRKIGLIAQDVEQVIPEVVSIDDEGYKSVEYGNIVSVLIEAIKAQQAQIEELKARIELLEQ